MKPGLDINSVSSTLSHVKVIQREHAQACGRGQVTLTCQAGIHQSCQDAPKSVPTQKQFTICLPLTVEDNSSTAFEEYGGLSKR